MRIGSTLFEAAARVWRDNGVSLASAIAFSFLLSIFPFMVFAASLADAFSLSGLVADATSRLFSVLPDDVAETMLPQINAAVKNNRFGFLTIGGLIMLFFASSGLESLRTALNVAYRDEEHRSFFRLRKQSILFVIECAVVMLLLGSILLFAGEIAGKILPYVKGVISSAWLIELIAYVLSLLILIIQLLIFHAWLPAGRRSFGDLWPGVLVSLILWLVLAAVFSLYTTITNYRELYAGLSQFVGALVFFHFTSVIIILGAAYNRARISRRTGATTEPATAQDQLS